MTHSFSSDGIVDEFQFLSSDAKRVGRTSPLPKVTRENFEAESGRNISVLNFAEDGLQQTPALFFLHGAGLNAHTFDPTILAMGRSAYSIDLPGHGKSQWREDATYSPFTLAADVASVVSQISSSPVNLVGHSLGGLTAAEIVAETPELVNKLVVLDITPGLIPKQDASSINEFITGQRDFSSIEEIVDRAVSFGIGTDRSALRRGVTLNTRIKPDGRYEWTHHLAHLDGLQSTAQMSTSIKKPFAQLWDPLTTLRGSLALIRGTEGLVSNEMTQEWCNLLPEAAVVTIAGGHNLHEHNPKKLAENIIKIVESETI